jgi:hypothetical protein
MQYPGSVLQDSPYGAYRFYLNIEHIVMNQKILVTRKIALSNASVNNIDDSCIKVLSDHPAIHQVAFKAGTLRITYDQNRMVYSELLQLLQDNLLELDMSWFFRLKAAWLNHLETTARENALAPPPACCNKAPKKGRSR